jgi:hypothetical protein
MRRSLGQQLFNDELYSSPSFRNHFFQLLDGELPKEPKFIAARHSVSYSLGQSDVELELETAGERWVIMVENKIDAVFQPDQAKRYIQRGEQYLATGYANFVTVLMAPSKYLGEGKYGFNITVPYEQLLEWFNADDRLGERRHCKVGILKAAIEKYAVENDGPGAKNPASIAFFREYYKVLLTLAPELNMEDKPKDGGFLFFHPPNLPKYLKLMHRIRQRYVDLQFSGMADQTDELRFAFSKVLPPDFHVRRVGGSAAIGIKVQQLIRETGFEPQRSNAEETIRQATRLWHGSCRTATYGSNARLPVRQAAIMA